MDHPSGMGLAHDSEWGPHLPKDHKLGTKVPGTTHCSNCRYLRDKEGKPVCVNLFWVRCPKKKGGGGGNERIPGGNASNYCCDLWKKSTKG